LLNVLAGEVQNNSQVSGSVLVNGQLFNGKKMKNLSGFVFQDDLILATMTVRKAIAMSAQLRLPQSVSPQEKAKRVKDVIEILHLEKCVDTIVGSTLVKGISGGERKRTSMAMEMVINPSVLYLDEPTSGLDTYTAYSVISSLSDLAAQGRTVIATIHQPSSEIFHMFDDLLLLAEGEVMYYGKANEVVSYFAIRGYQCPQYSNPADFVFMSILNNTEEGTLKTAGLASETSAERISRLLQSWKDSDENKKLLKDVEAPLNDDINAGSLKQKIQLHHSVQISVYESW